MNGGINIGSTRLNTSFQNRHIYKCRTDIDDDLYASILNQLYQRLAIHGIDLMRMQDSSLLKATFVFDALGDGITFISST